MFCFFLIFMACAEKQERPADIWTKAEFAEVIKHFQLSEAVVRLGYHRGIDSTYANDSIYISAFRDAGVTQKEFEYNMDYYLERPEELSAVYDLALEKLSEESARLKERKVEEFKIVE